MEPARIIEVVAQRDGLTPGAARVLIERWAWPLGLALGPAYTKAHDNHPDWQLWLLAERDTSPSLETWLLFTEKAGR